jgi:hypothetical protein
LEPEGKDRAWIETDGRTKFDVRLVAAAGLGAEVAYQILDGLWPAMTRKRLATLTVLISGARQW